jgi:hypothetical protein
MSTKITINYNGKNYDLEYTRATAAQIEDQGFSLDKMTDKPARMIPLLFHGAFLKHNRGIKPQLTDEIFKNLANKNGDDGESGIIGFLAEMYAETVQTLTDDQTIDEGNAAVWKVTKG